MVANPDYGWWETLRRVHPDLLGNFPELATGLLSPEGIQLVGAAGTARHRRRRVLARPARDRPPRLRARRNLRDAARAVELARHVRPRGHAAVAGVPRLHVRGLRRPRSPPTAWIYVETGEALRDRVGDLDTEQAGAGRDGPAAGGASARARGDQAARRLRAHGLGRAARPAPGLALLRSASAARSARPAAPLRDPRLVRARRPPRST